MSKKEIMKRYHYKNTTFYERRNECLLSEYSDAVILDGLRHTLIKADRWQEFIENRSEKKKRELMGLE
ncbi:MULTISPECIES: hypothetical protein [unclassified Lactobacillus]|uniref:hypothetical protein n=1 Tax=unclassified Lactobacillus TaxID=2620435 RepID=UPI00226AF766|nr:MULTISPECIES: hypothetical protein [unclassified Lactobacillus]MCX8721252.1 hypothetical protein [Lactobacillus sp. B4010]MCX8731921.1 hypothetical protein [Lactobacillus sp. B4015]MCX8734392.1 hypothetical protein [Lactobacillus sp. B4012]